VGAALSLFALGLAGAGAPDPAALLRADLARWPPAEVADARLEFAAQRRDHLVGRLDWDVPNRDLLCGQVRAAERAVRAWGLVRSAAREMEEWGYANGARRYLAELRGLLGEADYAAGRLPPLPDLDDFAEIK
jgi:hypothetical protein